MTALAASSRPAPRAGAAIGDRVATLDWPRLEQELDQRGYASTGTLLLEAECDQLASLYDRDDRFRSRIVMARHNFGEGEYKYFAYPLPEPIAALRVELYRRLAPVANRWNERLRIDQRYPATHPEFVAACHAQGQTRPTPLMLKYRPGDYNCLHQDLYGDLHFPFQVVLMLSRPGIDFEGGEFVLVEQRPRMQSRAEVVPLGQGDAAIFSVNHRPVPGSRGYYRTTLRHGVSRLRRGQRFTAGIIFHDAR